LLINIQKILPFLCAETMQLQHAIEVTYNRTDI